MNFFIIAFLGALALANAGVIVAPAARVLQGPSSSTTIVGPDGSSISSIAPGGAVVADAVPAAAVVAAPALRSAVVAAPGLLATQGIVTRSGLLGGTVIAGPSGTVATSEPLAINTWAAAPLAATWAGTPLTLV